MPLTNTFGRSEHLIQLRPILVHPEPRRMSHSRTPPQITDSNPITPCVPTTVPENSGTCRRNVTYYNLRCSQIVFYGLITFHLQEFQSEGATFYQTIIATQSIEKHSTIFSECQNTTKKNYLITFETGI